MEPNMALLVLAYPEIATEDREWIRSIRERHDGLHYGVVEPHFTIVFPVDGVDRLLLVEHVRRGTAGVAEIDFVLSCAAAVPDVLSERTYTFLVPDEGQAAIVALHDRLYTGILARALRADIPYLPHVTVGSAVDLSESRALADELNASGFRVEGRVGRLDIVTYDGRAVETVEEVVLA
jgi:2'-5' RNA ligase